MPNCVDLMIFHVIQPGPSYFIRVYSCPFVVEPNFDNSVLR